MTQRPFDLWHMSGPPLSPWQLSTRLSSERFPAQIMRFVNLCPQRASQSSRGRRGTTPCSRVLEQDFPGTEQNTTLSRPIHIQTTAATQKKILVHFMSRLWHRNRPSSASLNNQNVTKQCCQGKPQERAVRSKKWGRGWRKRLDQRMSLTPGYDNK